MLDWMKIKAQVQYFVVSLVVSSILLGVALYFHLNQQAEWKNSKRKLSQVIIKYNQSKDREKLLGEYEKQFTRLKQKGIFGEEQRINWIETIQQSTDERRIPSVKFEITQSRKFNKDNLQDASNDIQGIDIYLSKMNLEFELMHEGDIFNLFYDLDSKANGLNMVNECQIINSVKEFSILESNTKSNIIGSCELIWFTFDEENSDQEDGVDDEQS